MSEETRCRQVWKGLFVAHISARMMIFGDCVQTLRRRCRMSAPCALAAHERHQRDRHSPACSPLGSRPTMVSRKGNATWLSLVVVVGGEGRREGERGEGGGRSREREEVVVLVVVQSETSVTRAAHVVVAKFLRLIRLKPCVRCHRADKNRYYQLLNSDREGTVTTLC